MEEDLNGESNSLVSKERMVSASPIMWPDQNCFGELDSSSSSSTPNWLNEVQKEDKKMLTELASLTHSQLMEKIQALQTFAYQLGIEEAKQMRRGICLQVFESASRKNGHSIDPTHCSTHPPISESQ
jgi:hypothetical protein